MSSSPPPTQDRHVPVLRERVVALLQPALTASDDGTAAPVLLDATLGMGGHAEALLEAAPHARVIGLDRDPQALDLAGARLERFGERFTPVHAVYDEIDDVLDDLEVTGLDAILFDLGVSSLQLDETERGFAYRVDAPLDMRMDPTTGRTAADVLNTDDAADLERILREYGEERFARRIARSIVRARESGPFTTSARLVDLLDDAIPAATRRTGGHPAKRTFQALRIEVNDELQVWRRALDTALARLRPGGRIAVLSYHSLEDRITKRALVAGSTSSAPPGLPVELPEHRPVLRLLTRGAERPDEAELRDNPRSASVRLRAAERLAPSSSSPPTGTARPPRTTRTGNTHPGGTP